MRLLALDLAGIRSLDSPWVIAAQPRPLHAAGDDVAADGSMKGVHRCPEIPRHPENSLTFDDSPVETAIRTDGRNPWVNVLLR